jgi:hypothetical protein
MTQHLLSGLRVSTLLAAAACLTLPSGGGAFAKGLDELSQGNPETAEGAAATGGEGGAAAAAKPIPPPSTPTSKAVAGNLSVGTSFGWLMASKSKGEWKGGGGMSDVTVAYKVATLNASMTADGTYRYAPMAVSGVEDEHSYRGMWEAHYFGGRMRYAMSPTLTAIGSGELGYVLVYMRPTDGLPQEKKHEANGVSIALGGGADWQLFEPGFTVGPRLNVGFGSFTTVQVSGAATFVF